MILYSFSRKCYSVIYFLRRSWASSALASLPYHAGTISIDWWCVFVDFDGPRFLEQRLILSRRERIDLR